jgi:hypothetical protein
MTNAVTEERRIIPASGVVLLADVGVPAQVIGLIVFVHGSGSGRRSPRNRRVATALQQAAFATVLIGLLSRRVEAVVDSESGKTFVSTRSGRFKGGEERWTATRVRLTRRMAPLIASVIRAVFADQSVSEIFHGENLESLPGAPPRPA